MIGRRLFARARHATASGRGRRTARLAAIVAALAVSTAGCDVNTALERVSEARLLSADLHVQFTKAADAANRAVMADTDEASTASAREAERATEAAHKDADALAPLLEELRFSPEIDLLEQFNARFAEYRALDRTILDLAVENTNLKAQRLSFSEAQEAADAFRDSLETLAPVDGARDSWHVKALAATAVASVREIQALQAPHIAEPDEAAMAAIEKRMASSEAAARNALRAMAELIQPTSRPHLSAASAALDRLMAVNTQIVGLSRRNSNVRSLALSLNEKAKLTAACDESLHALQEALAKRGFTGTRR
jgi:chemoreceptor-like protein with four helix bundle sensory module